MTTNATAAPRATAARRYEEQLTTLVDEQTRAYILGLALLTASREEPSRRPREGEETRTLLDEAIGRRYKSDPTAYARAVHFGREELARRARPADADAPNKG